MARDIVFDLLARDRASDTFKKVGKSADGLRGRLKRAFSPAVLATGFVAGASAAAAFGAASVKAFADAEAQQAKLTNAFKKFPQLAGKNAEALRRLNTELAKKTIYDDDATAAAQSILASFGLTERQIRELTPLMQDFASRTGKDLPTAATDLGKAILGQGRALKSVGIDFKDTGSAAENLDQIVAGLRAQVGGFAENEGKTASGQVQILKNRFGELEEKVGAKLLPVLIRFTEWLNEDGIPAIEKMAGKVDRFAAGWNDFWRGVGAAAVDVWLWLQPIIDAFQWWGDKAIWLADKLLAIPRALANLPKWAKENLDFASTEKADKLLREGGLLKEKRAMGGPVSAFKPYLVGERGPELFMPSSSGSIVPNHALGGVNVTNVIHGNDLTADQLLDAADRYTAWRLTLAGRN